MGEVMKQTVLPPVEVFQSAPAENIEDKQRILGGAEAQGWVETVCPPEGGMFSFYREHPYPRKGHPYTEAIEANNIVKRATLSLILPFLSKEMFLPALGFAVLPFSWKRKILTKVLHHYKRLADGIYGQHYLKPQFYNNCSKEIWNFTFRFLVNLGIEKELAHGIGKILATLIEYDDAYRYRLEDIMTETSKEKLKNPFGEFKRLLEIFISREKNIGPDSVYSRALSMGNARFIFLYPPIKRAFNAALTECDLLNLQLDEIDRYYCLNRPDYNFFGQGIANRMYFYGALKLAHKLKQEQPNN